MKKSILCVLGAAVVVIVSMNLGGNRAEAQTPSVAGTPPVGRLVDILMVAWPASTVPVGNNVKGKLLAMTDQWLIVESGNMEIWVPKEKVMTMTASR